MGERRLVSFSSLGDFFVGGKRSRWTDRSVGIAEAGGTIPWLTIKVVQGIARMARKLRGK